MPLNLIKPPALKKGDHIAILSPSWGGASVYPHRYESGIKQLETIFGLKAVEFPCTKASVAELAKNPQKRAKDFNDAINNPEIKGIITTIGGDDSVRLLPYIDYEAIRKNPKPFIGYSDPTTLHFAFLKAGVSSFYGPAILSTFAENGGMFEYAKHSFEKTLFAKETIGEIEPSAEWTDETLDWGTPSLQKQKRKREKNNGYKFLQGTEPVSGHLIGGCLEVLEMLKGTPVWPDLKQWEDGIFFIDLSEEAPSPTYLIRCLRNYMASGILPLLKGVLMGRPCNVKKSDFSTYDDALITAIRTEAGLNIPVVSRMDFGHTDPICTLPYGAMIEINPLKKTVSILESGVS